MRAGLMSRTGRGRVATAAAADADAAVERATEVVVGGPNPLTDREREGLVVALDGHSAAEIARREESAMQ